MDAAKFRTHQGIAYGCFLIIAITSLVGGIGALLPNLGGVFFLLVIPLMIASFFAIIIGDTVHRPAGLHFAENPLCNGCGARTLNFRCSGARLGSQLYNTNKCH